MFALGIAKINSVFSIKGIGECACPAVSVYLYYIYTVYILI